MPAQSGKTGLGGKIKSVLSGSVKKHRTDETVVPGGGDLPPGIENGIAQLVEAKIDEHKDGENKGKLFAFFSGVVVSVGEGDPAGCIGRRANKLVFLYPSKDGKKSVDDRVAELLNEMRLLGCDTSNLSEDDIEDALNALKNEAPYFAFRTWKGKATPQFPNPRTNTTFSGRVEYDADSSSVGGTVEDSTGEEDSGEGEDSEASSESPEAGYWEALGEAADNGDTDAAEKLQEAGKQYGVDTDAASDWASAAAEIAEKAGSGEGEGEGEESWTPSVDDTFKYKPKGAKKAIDITVTAVFESKGTLNAKGSDGKSYKSLKYDSEAKTIDGQKVDA